jgi:hypothetical protein
MALGVDAACPLNRNQNRWEQFLTKWGKQPTYFGRYFGDTTHNWVPGELLSLLANSPSAQSIRYILPFAAAGHTTTLHKNNYNNHGMEDYEVQFDVQGEDRSGKHLKEAIVREQGQENAKDTCESIAAALRFVDYRTGKHELVLPDSEAVFVFLNVEPQTTLNHYYWVGWAETVRSFFIDKETAAGTLELTQPLLPCLYCVCNENGPREPEITEAFVEKSASQWNKWGSPCRSLATPWPQTSFNVPSAIAATEAEVQAEWLAYGTLQQPTTPDAEVVVWQYRINIGMDATKRLFELSADDVGTVFDMPGNPVDKIPIDLSVTRQTPLNGHPITDYMLRRP